MDSKTILWVRISGKKIKENIITSLIPRKVLGNFVKERGLEDNSVGEDMGEEVKGTSRGIRSRRYC